MQDVRDKIGTVLDQLPDGTKAPLVQKFDLDSIPVAHLTLTGYQSIKELTEIARRRLKEPLESVDGVGSIDIVGGREREIHVLVDADRLRATGLSMQQVSAALARQNVEYPGGRMKQGLSEEMLRTLGRITEVQDFSKIIVSEQDDRPVTIGDIATVEDGVKEPRSLSRWDNVERGLAGHPQAVGHQHYRGRRSHLRERYDALKGTLPPGVNVIWSRDASAVHPRSGAYGAGASDARRYLRRDRGVLLPGSMRSTLIAAIAIPVSIISTYSLLLWMGFTLNR